MKFSYKASNSDGEVTKGIREALDKFELSRVLRDEGFSLLSAESFKEKSFKNFLVKILDFGTVSTQEKIVFSRNLGSMLEAGLPLSRALYTISKQSKNKKFKNVVDEINDGIKKGDSFSNSLNKYPKVFSPLFISMVNAGEQSGNLIDSLNVVSTQMEKNNELKKRIIGALVYPGVIVTAMIGIGIFMLAYIVPTLSKTFENLKVELPATTRFVIWVSKTFRENYSLVMILFIVLIIVFIWAIRTKTGRRIIDFILLHFPLITPLVRETNSARTARALASLLKSGVSYVDALDITYKVVQNSYFKEVIDKAKKQVEIGQPVSKIFEENEKLYPIFVSEMFSVGEETGELSEILVRVATFYESEVDRKTKSMSTIVEPVLMIIVGAGVGFFAVSMISPMYKLVENI